MSAREFAAFCKSSRFRYNPPMNKSAPSLQAAPAVAEHSPSAAPSVARPKPAPRLKTLAELRRAARAASIRRGTYNPGAGEPNPLYEKDPKKRVAMSDAIRAKYPGPFSNSTPYIRRCRDLDWGDDGDE